MTRLLAFTLRLRRGRCVLFGHDLVWLERPEDGPVCRWCHQRLGRLEDAA